jgi:hypothetical protein
LHVVGVEGGDAEKYLLRGRRRREMAREEGCFLALVEVGLFTVKYGNGRSEQLFLEQLLLLRQVRSVFYSEFGFLKF